MKSHLVESPLHNEHQTLFDVIIIDGVIDERITNTEIFKIGESLVGEAKHILKSLGKHNFCYGNSSAWGSNELHDTNTIFNAYVASCRNGDGEKHWKVFISNNELPFHGNILIGASDFLHIESLKNPIKKINK
ncbi:hypothetical protein RCL_jg20330.t1 [Rhizophagus clarus]|uniref:Uncharacterized protein n=1 Tax=Rhizophagus clarus TaxID=94130 RepID=A0A8H3KY93_9GLOM|nr:hypothetical protein RCL_jg20330.t1 [Rhizophagus clarus]